MVSALTRCPLPAVQLVLRPVVKRPASSQIVAVHSDAETVGNIALNNVRAQLESCIRPRVMTCASVTPVQQSNMIQQTMHQIKKQ